MSLGDRTLELPSSKRDGHFEGVVSIPVSEADALSTGTERQISFKATTPEHLRRRNIGEARLIPLRGISVISDIDDTIKISEIDDTRKMLANTFIRSFRDVPGMSMLYGQLAARCLAFHYVSSSPWQLYQPPESFRHDKGFPSGTYNLKSLALTFTSFDRSLQSITRMENTINLLLKRKNRSDQRRSKRL